MSNADLNALLLVAKDKDVVFIARPMNSAPSSKTALYLALDQRKIVCRPAFPSLSQHPIADFCFSWHPTTNMHWPHLCVTG